MQYKFLFSLLTLICLCSCHRVQVVTWKAGMEVSQDSVQYELVFGEPVQGVLVIKDDVDLGMRTCCLPPGITLGFKGGVIKNGTLVGDGTKIERDGVCFDRVRILGTWDVPEISTSLFRDLDYDNSLKDVVALASPNVANRIVIEEGFYQVSALRSEDVCVPIYSNTEVVLKGTVQMVPNGYSHYYIFRLSGNNITMTGDGTVVGDKHTHTGNNGEWGMGIYILNGHEITVAGLAIKDCWGDCVFIDDESTDVLIEKCRIDHGRRQGISIVSADGVCIKECTITNVGGTNPEYAIDVEPDKNRKVDHVKIENVTSKGCKGGFEIYGNASNAKVGTVTIRDCKVDAELKEPIAASKCDTLIIENNDIVMRNGWGCIYSREIGCFVLKDNTLWYNDGLYQHVKDWIRPRFGKSRIKMMDIEDCGATQIARNQERQL